MTFLSPTVVGVGGHQQPWKGSRFHHPKKVTSRIARKSWYSWRTFCAGRLSERVGPFSPWNTWSKINLGWSTQSHEECVRRLWGYPKKNPCNIVIYIYTKIITYICTIQIDESIHESYISTATPAGRMQPAGVEATFFQKTYVGPWRSF